MKSKIARALIYALLGFLSGLGVIKASNLVNNPSIFENHV